MSITSLPAPRALTMGLAMAGVAGAMSLQPTISPRSAKQQALVTGASCAGGLATGALYGRIVRGVTPHVPGGVVAMLGAMTVGGIVAQAWSNAGDGQPGPYRGALGSFGTLTATAGAAGLGLAGARALGSRTHALVGPALLVAGIGTLAWHERSKSTRATDAPSRVLEQSRIAAESTKYLPVNDVPLPLLPTVSSADRTSIISAESIGKHGRRFLHEAVPGSVIRRVMGEGVDPIRVYAGLATSSSVDGRVETAMSELERLGAFDGTRRQIMIVTPTGSGFVDPPSIQAAEFMARGHIASVAIQYADKPSIQATGSVPLAAQTTRRLLDAVTARVARMPQAERPDVVLFGESLGAWAQQAAFVGEGAGAMSAAGVAHTLWVGNPNESSFANEARAATDGTVREFDRIEDFDALPSTDRSRVRHVLLTHQNDPVANVNKATLAFQRPEWLPAHREHARGVPSSMHFVPGVSFAQGMVDLINGTHPVPGKFEAHAHDYRADLAEFVRVAYGHAAGGDAMPVSDEQVQRITNELVQLEKNREAVFKRDPSY